MTASLPAGYFDDLYAQSDDPWDFAGSAYEREKYAATLDALPRPHFDMALEVGCSIGVLTRQLAPRCGRLVATDVAEAALAQARARCAGADNVVFRRLRMPGEWPDGVFDLILFSEVLYYLSETDLAEAARRARASARPGAAVLLVHYVLPTNYPMTGDQAATRFIAETGFAVSLQRREEAYRLDLLSA